MRTLTALGLSVILTLLLVVPQLSPVLVALESQRVAPNPGDFIALSRDLYVNKASLKEFTTPTRVTGTQSILVIMVYFPDVAPTMSVSNITQILDYVTQYYLEASWGLLNVTWVIANPSIPWLQLPNNMSYYGAPGPGDSDARWVEFLVDSILAADPYVDYSQWSQVLIVHAGGDEAQTGNPNDIWSFAVYNISIQTGEGVRSFSISVISEFDPMGVAAHELGHSLIKWPDLYDYNYTREFVGRWGLMGEGCWNGYPPGSLPAHPMIWCKIKAGWVAASEVVTVAPGQSVTVTLTPHEYSAGVKAVRIPVNPADPTRYFLVEARAWVGFDAGLPGEGVLITYVDENLGSGQGIVRVVDSTPGDGDVDNGQWVPGYTYYNATLDLKITVVSASATTYTVTISYATAQATLEASPSTLPAGTSTVLKGSGFTPNSTVEVYFDSSLLAVVQADSSGAFTLEARIPAGIPAGQYNITAVDPFGVNASTVVQVTQPALSVDYKELSGILSVNASGLGSGMPYALTVDGVMVYIASSSPAGTLALNLTLPPLTPGVHVVGLVYMGSIVSPRYWTPDAQALVAAAVITVTDGVATRSYVDLKVEALNSTLQSLALRVASLESQVAALNSSVSQLQLALNASLEQLSQAISSLNSSIRDLTAGLNRLESRLNSVEGRIGLLNETVKQLTALISRLNSTINGLASDVAVINQSIAALSSHAAELNASLTRVESELRGIEASLWSLNTSLSDVEARLDGVNATLQSLAGQVSRLTSQVKALAGSLEALAASLESTANRLSSELSALNVTVSAALAEIQKFNETLASMNATLAEVPALKESLSLIQSQLTALNASLSMVGSQAEDAQNRLASLASTVSALKADVEATASELKAVSSRLVAAESKLSELENAVKGLENLKYIKEEVDSLKTSLQEAKEEAASARESALTTTLGGILAAAMVAALVSRLLSRS